MKQLTILLLASLPFMGCNNDTLSNAVACPDCHDSVFNFKMRLHDQLEDSVQFYIISSLRCFVSNRDSAKYYVAKSEAFNEAQAIIMNFKDSINKQ